METQVRTYSIIVFFILVLAVFGAYATLNKSLHSQHCEVWCGYIEEEDWTGRQTQKTIRIWKECN